MGYPPVSETSIRIGCRDNTRDEIENNDRPQRVQIAAEINRQNLKCPVLF